MGRAAEDQAKVKEDSSGKFSGSGNGKVIESTMTVVVEDKKSRALLWWNQVEAMRCFMRSLSSFYCTAIPESFTSTRFELESNRD